MKAHLRYLDPDFYVRLIANRTHKNSKKIKWKIFDFGIALVVYLIYAYLIYFSLGFILQTSTPIVIVTSGSMEPVIQRGDIIIIQGVTADSVNAPKVEVNQPLFEKYVREFANLNYANNESCVLKLAANGNKYLDCPQLESLTIDNKKINISETNDIVVYYDAASGKDIIHRAQVKLFASDGVYLITKGDNRMTNKTIDQDCNYYKILGEPKLVCALNQYPINMTKIRGKYLFKIPYLGYLKLWLFGH